MSSACVAVTLRATETASAGTPNWPAIGTLMVPPAGILTPIGRVSSRRCGASGEYLVFGVDVTPDDSRNTAESRIESLVSATASLSVFGTFGVTVAKQVSGRVKPSNWVSNVPGWGLST